jgi:LacI family transcriptional regulator
MFTFAHIRDILWIIETQYKESPPMPPKITIQDIADAMSLSRNTVSKALNNHPLIPQNTRERVIQKAIDLKYKQFSFQPYDETSTVKKTGNIVILTHWKINSISFFSEIIKGIEEKISSLGYNLVLSLVKPDDIENKTLPSNIHKNNIDGIICIDIFDKDYIPFILDTDIPCVFIDFIPNMVYPNQKYNIVLMENEQSSYTLTKNLIQHGNTEIGFIGDKHHCKGFYERWTGYQRALKEANLNADDAFSITLDDKNPYTETYWLMQQLKSLKKLPTAFVCANDDIAITVIRILKELGYFIPENIEVTGFGNIPDSEMIHTALTTVNNFRLELGTRAAESLFSRIERPDRHNEVVYLASEVVLRSTTR